MLRHFSKFECIDTAVLTAQLVEQFYFAEKKKDRRHHYQEELLVVLD